MVAATHANTFDPTVHITAGQLRRLGFYLSEMIPNGAFVRRVAVGMLPDEDVTDESASIALAVLEPFEVSV